MSIYVAFYVGGYVASLLNAYSQGNLTVSRNFYLLLWPLYGIITITEIVTNHSDTILAVGKAVLRGVTVAVKWFASLFKAK